MNYPDYGAMAHDYGTWPSVLKVEVVGKVADEEKCAHKGKDCCDIAIAAYQLTCGHRVCGKCRDDIMITIVNGGTYTCPHTEDDCEPTTAPLNPDAYMRKQMLKREIVCPNVECEQRPVWKTLDEHIDVCDYQPQKCSYEDCEQRIPRKYAEKHKKECRHEPLNCKLCGKGSTKAKIENHSETECEETVIPCPTGCGETFKRKALEVHTERCAMKPRPCKYRQYDCEFMGSPPTQGLHEKEFCAQHLDMVLRVHEEKFSRLEEQNRELRDKLHLSEQQRNQFEYRLHRLEQRPVRPEEELAATASLTLSIEDPPPPLPAASVEDQ